MPVNESHCGRKYQPRHSFKPNGVRKELVQDARLANSSTLYHGHCTYVDRPAPVQYSQGTTLNDIRPKNNLNGYANHGFWSTRSKIPGVFKRQENKPNCNSTIEQLESNRNSAQQPVAPAYPDQKPAESDPPITSKSQKKKKKPWHRRKKVATSCTENALQEPEDWEDDIQEVKAGNWEAMTFGTQPYGPADVVNFTLRDLSLERKTPAFWQVTSHKYLPAAHHRRPVEWFRYTPPAEPGQFSDAED